MRHAIARAGLPLTLAVLAAIALGALTGAFRPFDNQLRDWRYRAETRPASQQIAFVDIDAASLAAVGVWPWPRSLHARILDALMLAGADKVVFDVDFSTASNEVEDASFERALADAGGYAYLAAFRQEADGSTVENVPLARFARQAAPVAVNVIVDFDGMVRNYPIGMTLGGVPVPSAAALFADTAGPAGAHFGIDFSIDATSIPHVPVIDLLEGRVDPQLLAGRQVIVGASALELRDYFLVPRYGIMPGALLQALAGETLKAGRGLMPAGPLPALAGLMLLAGCAILTRRRNILWPAIAAGLAASVAAEAIALVLQMRAGVLLDTAAVHAGLGVAILHALAGEVRRRGEMHARAAAERDSIRVILDRVVTDNFDGVVVADREGRILAASRSAELLIGRSLSGRRIDELPEQLARALDTAFVQARAADAMGPREAILDVGGDQHILEYVVTPSEVVVAGEPRIVVSLTFRDITQRRAAEDRLRYLGRHDPVTGALNRTALLERAKAELAQGRVVAAVLIDLRRFRAINDTLGHGQGDLLLKQAVERMRGIGPDAVARLGGDTFALIAPVADTDMLRGFCESIITLLSFPYQLADGHQAIIAASAGATTSVVSGDDAETLLSHADMALSVAKQAPGSAAALFDPAMDRRLRERQAMDTAMRHAIAERAFAIAWQPQTILATGRIAGAEALLRWTDERLGVVSPAAFVAVAEETGLIVEIGRWTLMEACRQAARWPEPLRIAVNVSPVQFELGDVVADVEAALEASGLAPGRLDIEITEGVFVRNAVAVTRALERIRALGVGIALDDFGTGYSSLSYLGRLPLDKIKLDQSFVQRLPADGEALAIVTAVLSISRALGKTVVAEGIETQAQAEILRLGGAEFGQGYLFGRAMDEANLMALATTPVRRIA